MKKIILSLTMLTMAFSTQAQKIEIGVNAGLYTTWLMNKNVFDQNDIINHAFSGGPNFGFLATFNMSEKVGIGLELNFATVHQKYSGDYGFATYEAKETIHYTEIPILFKLKSEGGFYFEIGPKISLRGKATEEFTSDPSNPADYSSLNIEKGFKSTVVSIVFGFGGRFDLSDHLALTAGLRLAASLGDATEEYSQDELNNTDLEEEIGIADGFAHRKSNGDFKYVKTTLATGGLQMGLVYMLGDK
ncbi:MAG: porin family protein [Bacteroidia bacterium]